MVSIDISNHYPDTAEISKIIQYVETEKVNIKRQYRRQHPRQGDIILDNRGWFRMFMLDLCMNYPTKSVVAALSEYRQSEIDWDTYNT